MMENPYELAQAFHRVFDPRIPDEPQAFDKKDAVYRAGFKAEELVELLYAAADNDQAAFKQMVADLKESIDQAQTKVLAKQEPTQDPLVEEVDALVDLLYFTYGSFALLGVDPTRIFEIVHEANMGKLFADGQPHYHPVTNKVLKPDNWETDFAPEVKIAAELKRQRELKE